MKATRPTHEEHLVFAMHFRELRAKLSAVDRFPKNHRTSNAFRKVRQRLEQLRHELDNEYHAVTTEEQFLKAGHVYYNRQ